MMRAIRNRYFARSEGASFAQPSSKASSRGAHREIDVFRARQRDLEQRLLRRRRDRLEPLARSRLDLLAAHEEAVALADLDDVARLGRRSVLPLERSGNGRGSLFELCHQSIVK